MDGSAFRHVGDGIVGAFQLMFWLLVASIPLAIWKLVDIGIWLFGHLTISWS